MEESMKSNQHSCGSISDRQTCNAQWGGRFGVLVITKASFVVPHLILLVSQRDGDCHCSHISRRKVAYGIVRQCGQSHSARCGAGSQAGVG